MRTEWASYVTKYFRAPQRSPSTEPDEALRIIVNDYAGHPFQAQLSRVLAARGHEVNHLYCSTNSTPHGDLTDHGWPTLDITPISTGTTFEKYSLAKRARQEIRYGFASARVHRRHRPDVILTSNVPVLSVLVIRLLNRGTRQILWLQDIQSGLVALKLQGPKKLLARLFAWFEALGLRSADGVVAIADSLASEAVARGVEPAKIDVIENWAPLSAMPVRKKSNRWARDHGIDDAFVFLYAGTLGIKHRPELLLDLCQAYADDPGVRVVVVSEGVGADRLAVEAGRAGVTNLVLQPFQRFEDLPNVLGSADVLVAVLAQDTGSFSIPSKILSYMCARRPILASLPSVNASSELIETRSRSGLVAVHDSDFMQHAERLRHDHALRDQLAGNGRTYAESTFDIETISKSFVEVLRGSANELGR